MTDPLTTKELVQKSYEYVDKLTKECAKSILEEYNKTHKKFEFGNVAYESASNICEWFEKRERNIRLKLNAGSVNKISPAQIRMKLEGNTKDADFSLDASVGIFVRPGEEITDKTVCYPKSLILSADKSNFGKRKS